MTLATGASEPAVSASRSLMKRQAIALAAARAAATKNASGDYFVTDPALTAGLLFAAAHAAVDGYLACGGLAWERYTGTVEELVTRAVAGPTYTPPSATAPHGAPGRIGAE